MEKLMKWKMGRGEFLRKFLLLAGGAFLDPGILRDRGHAADPPAGLTSGKTGGRIRSEFISLHKRDMSWRKKSARRTKSGRTS